MAATLLTSGRSRPAPSPQPTPGRAAKTLTPTRDRLIDLHPEPSLLQRVAAGEPGSVELCLDQFGGLVWSLARRFAGNPADAEDAVQEIFTEIWSKADRYDPAIASETTYVAMIARRRLIDQQRKRGRAPRLEPLDSADHRPTEAEPSKLEVDEQVHRVQEVIATLKPQQQDALRMAIYENCSHAEIAQEMDLPLGTVKTNIRRGLMKVRQMLGVESDTPDRKEAQ